MPIITMYMPRDGFWSRGAARFGQSRQVAMTDIQANRAECGFTLIEVLISFVISLIVVGISAAIMTNVIPNIRADSSLEMVLAQLQQAREGAIDQRRTFIVTFKGTNEITVQRQELSGTLTMISDYFLDTGVIYTVLSNVPDTPDGFDPTGIAVDLDTGTTINFLPDGTATDSTNVLLAGGTVFMGIPGTPLTARAVTVMGATGRIAGYAYGGTSWSGNSSL